MKCNGEQKGIQQNLLWTKGHSLSIYVIQYSVIQIIAFSGLLAFIRIIVIHISSTVKVILYYCLNYVFNITNKACTKNWLSIVAKVKFNYVNGVRNKVVLLLEVTFFWSDQHVTQRDYITMS